MTSQRRLLPRLVVSVTLLFISSSITFAQTAETKTKATASVEGRVTVGDKPAAGIIVAVNVINSQTLVAQTTSDAEGKYRLNGLAPGQITVGTFAPTCVAPASPMFVPGRVLNLAADETIEGIDFKLTRGGVITGRVSDGEGKPVVDERVSLDRIDESAPSQAAVARSMATRPANPYIYNTDDRGIYRIYGLPPGRYKVSVGDAAGGMGTLRGGGYYARTYYPDTTDASRASIVEVTEGGEAKNIDINVGVRSRTYTVSGRIIDADTNQPLPGVQYSFGTLRQDQTQTYVSGSYSPPTPTNSKGEFRLEGIEPGRYAIMVARPNTFASTGDPQSGVYSDPVSFEVNDSDVADLEVKAHLGLSISGVVITEGITDKRALAAVARLLVAGFVEPSSGGIQGFVGGVTSPIAADGSFQLDGLRPGRATLSIAPGSPETRGFTVSRIVYERELPRGQIELVAGQNLSGVRIYLAYGVGIVKGEVKVQGGVLPPDALMFVALQRENQMEMGRASTAQVDARGRFVITGVPAGTYDAILQILSFGSAVTLPRGFQRTQRQPVTVSDDSEIQIAFTIDLTPKEGP